MKSSLIIVALASFVAMGCSKKSDANSEATGEGTGSALTKLAQTVGGSTTSCMHAAIGMCAEYSGLGASDVAEAKQECGKDDGKWADGACPTADLLGTCSHKDPHVANEVRLKLYKGTALSSADEAKSALCSDEGDVFTAN